MFGSRQCERIIEAGLALPRESAEVSDGDQDALETGTRDAAIAWMAPSEHDWVFEKLAGVVARANKVYGYDLIGFTEDAQFTRYEHHGAFYDWHQDGLEGELAGRKLSLVVQLSDPADYDGGDLELFTSAADKTFLEQNRAVFRSRGTVIVFPAVEHHRVTPMTAGCRYSLVCWVGGPPFR